MEKTKKKKPVFFTELSYLFGIVALAVGVTFMERSDFGVSMVVAPAYVLYRAISRVLPFFTFGMAEYSLQAALLLLMIPILRKFRFSYLFSFVTAVFYGFVLDGCMALLSLALPPTESDSIFLRIVFFVIGALICSMGVSLIFHTYISPEVYELFVKEVSKKFQVNINRFKTGYDITSALVAVALSFLFFGFGHFEGVKWGTLVCALVNGTLIGLFSKLFDRVFVFRDGLPLRRYFEDEAESNTKDEK